jgi:hypothetical protein
LTRSDAALIGYRSEWPAPNTSESFITLLRPVLATNILSTCHLIEALKAEPIQYLVDWAAVCALTDSIGALSACLSLEGCFYMWSEDFDAPDQRARLATRAFVSRCRAFFRATQDHHKGIARSIVVTVDQDQNFPWATEFVRALGNLEDLSDGTDMRLEVVYKTPMPDCLVRGELRAGAVLENSFVGGFERAVIENMQDAGRGTEVPAVSMKALGESAFATHLGNLT